MLSIHTEAMENSNTPIQLFAHKMYVYVLQYVCMYACNVIILAIYFDNAVITKM